MANVLFEIAEGVFLIIRLFFAVLSTGLGVASLAVPWRFAPGVAALFSCDCTINDWIVVNWVLFFLSLCDIFTLVPFFVTLCSWRNWKMLAKIKKKWKSSCLASGEQHYNEKIRLKIWGQFFAFIYDIPFFIMILLSTAMIWRAPIFYKHLISGINKGIRADDRRFQILIDTMIGLADIFLIPVGLLIVLTGYRIKETLDRQKDIEEPRTDRFQDSLSIFLKRRLHVLEQGGYILVDFLNFLLVIFTCICLIRIPALIQGVRKMRQEKEVTSKRFWNLACENFALTFRELLALLCYVIMLPFGFRFYLAISSVIQKCSKQADPRPHCQVTKVVPEFLPKGFKLHIKGHKTPDLPDISNLRMFIRDDVLWDAVSDAVGSTAVILGKGFLPLKLEVLDADFVKDSVDFETTIHFDIPATKKAIVKGIEKVGGGTVAQFDFEWGKAAGKLMSIRFRLGSVIEEVPDEETELDLRDANEPSGDVRDTTSAYILDTAAPVPGELFCNAMAGPAFIQFASFLSDLLALILFVLIHLVPWRAYTMYRSMTLPREDLKKFVAVKEIKKLRKIFDTTEEQLEKSYAMVDEKFKRQSRDIYSYSTYIQWNYCYQSDDETAVTQFKNFMGFLTRRYEKIGKLYPEAAKEVRLYILSVLRSHCAHTTQGWEKMRYTSTVMTSERTGRWGTHTTVDIEQACEWVPLLRKEIDAKQDEDPEVFLSVPPLGDAGQNQLGVQRAYREAERVKQREVTTRQNIRSALSTIVQEVKQNTAAVSCKKLKFKKKAIYSAVRDFATDLAALLCVLLLVVTVYRIPVLVRSMRDSYSFHHTAFSNAFEIPIDFLYLLKSVFIFLGVRSIFIFPVDVFEYTVLYRSYEAARKVVDYYFEAVVYDYLQLLGRICSCESFKWVVGGVAVGFLTPGVLVEQLIIRDSSGLSFCSGMIVLLTSGWLYGWAGASVGKFLPDGDREMSFIPYYAVLLMLMVAYLLSVSLSSSELKESVRITHSRFVRPNWFNILQFLYAALEGLWAVAVVGRLYPDSDLHGFFRAVLLDVDASDGYPLGTYFGVVAIGTYYLVVALPIIVMALDMSTKMCGYNSWVFFMGLLSQGVQLLVVFNATNVLFCDDTEGYEGGTFAPFGDAIHCYYDTKHITLSALSMLGFGFYSLTTIMKIPEYTTSHCTLLDIVFVELYESLVRLGIMVLGVMAVVLRHHTDTMVGVALACLVWCICWTIFYPYVFRDADHVCSVQLFTVWRLACYAVAAASIIAIRANQSSGTAVTFAVFGILLAGTAAAFLWKMVKMHGEDVVGLTVTPDQVQQDMLALHSLLRSKGALAGGLSDGAWEAMVSGNTRASPLAIALMQLEHYTRLSHLHPAFLSLRSDWYSELWELVDDDDVRRDYHYKLRYYSYYDSFFWSCGCCDESISDHTNGRLVNSVEDIASLNTLLQRYKNAIASDNEIVSTDHDALETDDEEEPKGPPVVVGKEEENTEPGTPSSVTEMPSVQEAADVSV